MPAPVADASAGALLPAPGGGLALVTPTTLAVTRDGGGTWETTALASEERFTNNGRPPYVSFELITSDLYAHAPPEASVPVERAVWLSPTELLVVADGRTTTRLSLYFLDGAQVSRTRTFVAKWGGGRTARSYNGPFANTFGGGPEPLIAGQLDDAPVIFQLRAGGAEWAPMFVGDRRRPLPVALSSPTSTSAWALFADGTLSYVDAASRTVEPIAAIGADRARLILRMDCAENGNGYLYGEHGTLLAMREHGHSLRPLTVPTDETLVSVLERGDTELWAATASGALYVSHDGGHFWDTERLPTDASLTSITLVDGEVWAAAGAALYHPLPPVR